MWDSSSDLRHSLAIMRELEASLQSSRTALLTLDLNGIEGGTRRQAGLMEELEAIRKVPTAAAEMNNKPSAKMRTEVPDSFAAELEQEIRRSALRILAATRLQSALLARARWKLGVLANALAGPDMSYSGLWAKHRQLKLDGDWRI